MPKHIAFLLEDYMTELKDDIRMAKERYEGMSADLDELEKEKEELFLICNYGEDTEEDRVEYDEACVRVQSLFVAREIEHGTICGMEHAFNKFNRMMSENYKENE